MTPFVSIIIPVYNTQKKYLDACLNSVLNQTFTNFEVLLVDDGSKESCAKELEKWGEKDVRIRLYTIPNSGVSYARNFAVNHAEGEYLLFVDSDDLINQNWLAWASDVAIRENADAVFGIVKGIPRDGNIPWQDPVSGDYILLEEQEMWKLQCGQLICGMRNNDPCLEVSKFGSWGKLFRRKVVNEVRFPEDMYYGEDQLFTHEAIKRLKRAVYGLDYCYYLLVDRPGSATNTYDSKRLQVLESFIGRLKDRLLENKSVQNAFYIFTLFKIDNHVDHALKTRETRPGILEIREMIQEAMGLPVFKEALENADLSVLHKNKAFIRLWMVKHQCIMLLAIWNKIK